jgi:hypothetical protein
LVKRDGLRPTIFEVFFLRRKGLKDLMLSSLPGFEPSFKNSLRLVGRVYIYYHSNMATGWFPAVLLFPSPKTKSDAFPKAKTLRNARPHTAGRFAVRLSASTGSRLNAAALDNSIGEKPRSSFGERLGAAYAKPFGIGSNPCIFVRAESDATMSLSWRCDPLTKPRRPSLRARLFRRRGFYLSK